MAGAVTSNSEIVSENNSGRSLADQAVLMLKARAKRKAQRGYKATFEEALNSKHQTFDDGILAPMLAQRLEKSRHKNGVHHSVKMFEQPKLDGHRCQIVKTTDGEMKATSRLGTPITTIDHLLEKLKPSMPDDLPIDGELYVHGWKVQHVASAVKRLQEDTQKVTFQAYDVYDMDQSFGLRFDTLMGIMRPAHLSDNRLNVVFTGQIYGIDDAWERFQAYRALGYEGAMLFITHDRYFMKQVAKEIWHLNDKQLTRFPGTLTEYLERDDKPKTEETILLLKMRQAELSHKLLQAKKEERPHLEKEFFALAEKIRQLNMK